jgi:MobA-like NTP transferase domain
LLDLELLGGVVLNAVVLGGGRDDPFAQGFGVPVKALIPIHGVPMAAYVLRALRESGRVGRIVYVGPVSPALEGLFDVNVQDHGAMLENLELGLAALPANERVLVSTADVPLLTAESVRDLLTRDSGAGVVYPIIPMAISEARFPGGKRTAARAREGRFTGGNLFLLEPGLVKKFMPRLKQMIANRKNVLALAGLIGLPVLVKFLLGTLTLRELEGRVSRILGVEARLLITDHAEIGFDVDKLDDLEVAIRALKAG